MWEERFQQLSVAAIRQHGLITAAQAKRAGLDESMLDRFKGFRLIHELDWSVYQLSGSSYGPRYAYPYAAWLALEPELFSWERPTSPAEDAVLSHESACALLGIGAVSSPVVRFTSEKERDFPHAMRIDVAPLTPDDVTVYEGVPVTTPHRVIVDLVAEWASKDDISRVFTDAVRRDMVNLHALFDDLIAMSETYDLPRNGDHFFDYFMPGLPLRYLSSRNLRAYAELSFPEKVSDVRARIADLLVELGEDIPEPAKNRVSSEIAAEIVGRTQ
ncbi:hypothetical protein [Nocardia donostiensis]|nr:hypothetical protein [Nocardia donostiensis]